MIITHNIYYDILNRGIDYNNLFHLFSDNKLSMVIIVTVLSHQSRMRFDGCCERSNNFEFIMKLEFVGNL